MAEVKKEDRADIKKEIAVLSLKNLLESNSSLYPIERQAIEYAITELERTAQEVSVQEQSISSYLKCKITINGLNTLKNIDTNSSLKLDSICTGKTRIEINLLKT